MGAVEVVLGVGLGVAGSGSGVAGSGVAGLEGVGGVG